MQLKLAALDLWHLDDHFDMTNSLEQKNSPKNF